MIKPPHGNTGNQSARKTAPVTTGKAIITGAPEGLHEAIRRHVHPRKVSPWIREAIYAQLAAEGYDPAAIAQYRALE